MRRQGAVSAYPYPRRHVWALALLAGCGVLDLAATYVAIYNDS